MNSKPIKMLLVLLILFTISCSGETSEKVVSNYYNMIKQEKYIKATSYMTFEEYEEVYITKEDYISDLEKEAKNGFELIDFDILTKKDNDGLHFERVDGEYKKIEPEKRINIFVIAKEQRELEGTKNQLYELELIQRGGKWKIAGVSKQILGAIPFELRNIFNNPQDVENYEFESKT
ncbi:hypothetical protein [Pontibacillus marinus]|uniref:DUF4878 domain-containing protein n=2 Tax=Bacillaceae TaxID=186817 RepID=A0A0A5FTW8_9BACI|nr:hypothetical protein [Pontibacillus marinus]KGX83359.1 hypothetical protein N783_04335 [Pontibacillus marinus BH030004 = DSM 16465]